MKRTVLLLATLIFCISNSYSQSEKVVWIQTTLGDIKIKLYNETPRHRDNFIKLVEERYYDSVLFHRVIKNFMIQAGDPASKHAKRDVRLGDGGPGYTVPAEFNDNLIHKKGAVAAARTSDDVNPTQASSGSQFYIVQGKTLTDEELDQTERRVINMRMNRYMRTYITMPENNKLLAQISTSPRPKQDSLLRIVAAKVDSIHKNEPPFKFTPQQREVYKTIGGTPHLDSNYTVFGEVIEGLDVIDKIASVKTGPADRPVDDVRIISMRVIN